ncbi:type IV pilus modification protein PilV [Halomonas maura]|uniref:type IV pilus modification protein PilV n=1 Tax=Halomonas maura TaxID=117606 RepID=UPI0025B4D9D4|nr:type IV pilus modification protein PilV [Halomonas maura]MDN3557131.1 type IV pilus modification protein PilV [Halomonas maura]
MRKSFCKLPQLGFTLIEVLIAVLVVAVGVLGLAAMELKGLQSSGVAYQRTLATAAAQDGVERLWAELWSDNTICPAPSDVTGDWYAAWNDILEDMEDSGSVIEQPDAASNPCLYQVIVQWSEGRFSDETDTARLVYRAKLPGGVAP